MKRVRLTLEVDSEFVKLLQANVQLSGLLKEDRGRLTPSQVLAVIVLGEARGALEEQIHAQTPPEWRPHIEAIHSERKVTEIKD
jgi:hypothetical protein